MEITAATTSEQIHLAASDFLTHYTQTYQQNHPDHQLKYEISNIDERLRLADCQTPLSSRFSRSPDQGSNTTLEISCTEPQPWRIFLGAKVEIQGPALITRSALPRGARIDARHIETQIRTLNGQHRSLLLDLHSIEGVVLRRAVTANTLLTADLVEMPALVSKNDRIVISARSGAISVESWGIALTDGHLDEQIDVRNEQSGKVVRGRVTHSGRVEITF